jgi:hypothetical protein
MIRLFKKHAKFLLLMLIMWKQMNSNGHANRAVVDQVSLWLRANPTHPAALWVGSLDWVDAIDRADVDEQIETLLEGLSNDPTNSKGDVSIISTIIEILGLPWTGNRLGSEAIAALRKAILRPSEVANFQKVAKESFQCTSCGHKFVGNEAAIVQRGAQNELRINCIRCQLPTYGACGTCGESAQITAIGAAALATTKFVSCDCGSSKGRKKESLLNDANTLRRNASRGASTGRPSNPLLPFTVSPTPTFSSRTWIEHATGAVQANINPTIIRDLQDPDEAE